MTRGPLVLKAQDRFDQNSGESPKPPLHMKYKCPLNCLQKQKEMKSQHIYIYIRGIILQNLILKNKSDTNSHMLSNVFQVKYTEKLIMARQNKAMGVPASS